MAKDPAAIFAALRSKVLALTPQEAMITPLPAGTWGALMEFAVAGVSVTLVALADGSSSMYFGSGGGVIGAGKHKPVQVANRQFLEAVERLGGSFKKTTSYPTAENGRVRFYALRTDGVYGSDSLPEDELVQQRHAAAPLFWAGQNLITQIRLAAEKPKQPPAS